MPSYRNDPRWITARFASSCGKCGGTITKGERIFYYPATKRALGAKCGCAEDAAGEFAAAAADEAFMSGGM